MRSSAHIARACVCLSFLILKICFKISCLGCAETEDIPRRRVLNLEARMDLSCSSMSCFCEKGARRGRRHGLWVPFLVPETSGNPAEQEKDSPGYDNGYQNYCSSPLDQILKRITRNRLREVICLAQISEQSFFSSR